MATHKIFEMKFGEIYPHYVTKITKKGRSEEELLSIISWLTGYENEEVHKINTNGLTFQEFFDQAPAMNENRELIKGSICGVKVQEVEDPLMKSIRQLDKIVDELAKGKALEKIMR